MANLLASAVLTATLSFSFATRSHADERDSTTVPDSAARLEISCDSASYRFLPGDFNGCMGRKLWMNGQPERAESWLLLAAGWGDKMSQFLLGIGHFNGDGLELNRPLGYAWLALASESRAPENVAVRDAAWNTLTSAERSYATSLLTRMKSKFSEDVATVRAERHYQRELNELKKDLIHFRQTCITGITAEKGALVSGTPENPTSCTTLTGDVVEKIQVQHDQYFDVFNKRGKVIVSPPVQLRENP